MRKLSLLKRKEPLNDTQLLMTITIAIFFVMYILAIFLLGGGFLHAQQIFAMLTLALMSSTGNVKSQKPRQAKNFAGLASQPAFAWMKKRAANSATSRLTTAPTMSSCAAKDQVSRIQKA